MAMQLRAAASMAYGVRLLRPQHSSFICTARAVHTSVIAASEKPSFCSERSIYCTKPKTIDATRAAIDKTGKLVRYFSTIPPRSAQHNSPYQSSMQPSNLPVDELLDGDFNSKFASELLASNMYLETLIPGYHAQAPSSDFISGVGAFDPMAFLEQIAGDDISEVQALVESLIADAELARPQSLFTPSPSTSPSTSIPASKASKSLTAKAAAKTGKTQRQQHHATVGPHLNDYVLASRFDDLIEYCYSKRMGSLGTCLFNAMRLHYHLLPSPLTYALVVADAGIHRSHKRSEARNNAAAAAAQETSSTSGSHSKRNSKAVREEEEENDDEEHDDGEYYSEEEYDIGEFDFPEEIEKVLSQYSIHKLDTFGPLLPKDLQYILPDVSASYSAVITPQSSPFRTIEDVAKIYEERHGLRVPLAANPRLSPSSSLSTSPTTITSTSTAFDSAATDDSLIPSLSTSSSSLSSSSSSSSFRRDNNGASYSPSPPPGIITLPHDGVEQILHGYLLRWDAELIRSCPARSLRKIRRQFAIFHEMKRAGLKCPTTFYNALLKTCASEGLWRVCLSIMRDMVETSNDPEKRPNPYRSCIDALVEYHCQLNNLPVPPQHAMQPLEAAMEAITKLRAQDAEYNERGFATEDETTTMMMMTSTSSSSFGDAAVINRPWEGSSQPDLYSYNMILQALANGAQPLIALSVLEIMFRDSREGRKLLATMGDITQKVTMPETVFTSGLGAKATRMMFSDKGELVKGIDAIHNGEEEEKSLASTSLSLSKENALFSSTFSSSSLTSASEGKGLLLDGMDLEFRPRKNKAEQAAILSNVMKSLADSFSMEDRLGVREWCEDYAFSTSPPEPSSMSYSIVFDALTAAERPKSALNLISRMVIRNRPIAMPDALHLASAIRCAYELKNYQLGFWLLRVMRSTNQEDISLVDYTHVLSACKGNDEHTEYVAREVFSYLRKDGHVPNIIAFNAYLSAMKSWRSALAVYVDMTEHNIKPTLETYTAAITACMAEGKQTAAERVLKEAESNGNLSRHAITELHCVIIDGLSKQGNLTAGLAYYERLKADGVILPERVTGSLFSALGKQEIADSNRSRDGRDMFIFALIEKKLSDPRTLNLLMKTNMNARRYVEPIMLFLFACRMSGHPHPFPLKFNSKFKVDLNELSKNPTSLSEVVMKQLTETPRLTKHPLYVIDDDAPEVKFDEERRIFATRMMRIIIAGLTDLEVTYWACARVLHRFSPPTPWWELPDAAELVRRPIMQQPIPIAAPDLMVLNDGCLSLAHALHPEFALRTIDYMWENCRNGLAPTEYTYNSVAAAFHTNRKFAAASRVLKDGIYMGLLSEMWVSPGFSYDVSSFPPHTAAAYIRLAIRDIVTHYRRTQQLPQSDLAIVCGTAADPRPLVIEAIEYYLLNRIFPAVPSQRGTVDGKRLSGVITVSKEALANVAQSATDDDDSWTVVDQYGIEVTMEDAYNELRRYLKEGPNRKGKLTEEAAKKLLKKKQPWLQKHQHQHQTTTHH